MAEMWRQWIVGVSAAIEAVVRLIRLAGPRRTTVLISGETGTGKEVAARALHAAGPRVEGPMVSINCSALPENLLEAELFGHVKGAFTGAISSRAGRFEQAHGGTIFLDEIGEMPLELQAKLLRVLQEREIQRLGSSETIPIDVRVIAATNQDLEKRCREGAFREDLYYRLNVFPLRLPPLRDRREDIPLLAEHFAEKVCRLEGLPPKKIDARTMSWMMDFPWPGNVRQLENAIEMATALSGVAAVLTIDDFAGLTRPLEAGPVRLQASPWVTLPDQGLDFERTIEAIERSLLEQALSRTNGNKKRAADMLHLNRTTLTAKLKSLAATGGVRA